MAKIYESIMSLIKPGRIATAAATLDENEHKVAAGADIILPSLLAMMLKKGDTPEIEEVFKTGKKIKAWENYDKIWHGDGVDEHVNLGERMENRLLSSHNPKFNTDVGHKVGLRAGLSDRLTNWVSGTIAAWFSQQIAGGKSYKSLLASLSEEKAELRKGIPADIVHDLGLAHTLGVHAEPAHKPATHPTATPQKPAAATVNRDPIMVHPTEPKRPSLGWLWWLLGLIALILIIFWCVRSCGHRRVADPVTTVTTAVTGTAAAVTGAAGQVVAEVKKEVNAAPKFEGVQRVLPDGTKVTVYQGHLEEAVKAYLDSDKFKNGTDAELRSVWFGFTDIDFEHNKATELMTGSPERLLTLVNVLKNYPNVKIKVGSFGDKTGTRAANYQISEKRALTIMEALKASGFPAANLSHEGFGKEFAAAPATAPDAERAPDRDVAMRFTK